MAAAENAAIIKNLMQEARAILDTLIRMHSSELSTPTEHYAHLSAAREQLDKCSEKLDQQLHVEFRATIEALSNFNANDFHGWLNSANADVLKSGRLYEHFPIANADHLLKVGCERISRDIEWRGFHRGCENRRP